MKLRFRFVILVIIFIAALLSINVFLMLTGSGDKNLLERAQIWPRAIMKAKLRDGVASVGIAERSGGNAAAVEPLQTQAKPTLSGRGMITAEEFRKNPSLKTGNPLIDDYGKNNLTAPGENGRAVLVPDEMAQNVSAVMETFRINVLASDIMPLNRLVPDSRFPLAQHTRASMTSDLSFPISNHMSTMRDTPHSKCRNVTNPFRESSTPRLLSSSISELVTRLNRPSVLHNVMATGPMLNPLFTCVIIVFVDAVHPAADTCHSSISCGFQDSTCGFTSNSPQWKRPNVSGAADISKQGYEVFQSDRNSLGDLISPWMCKTGAVHVQLSSLIVVSPKYDPVELRVLTSCDDLDLKGQPLLAIVGPVLSWKRYNFTLPACTRGQRQRVTFRAISTSPESSILLDDVLIRPVVHRTTTACTTSVSCGFLGTTCGFTSRSADWNLQNASTAVGRPIQGYQVFRSHDDSEGDLVSPPLCNERAVHVGLASLIMVTEKNEPVELRVLTTCNDVDLKGQALQAIAGPMTSWRRFSFTLPTCPRGQGRRVVFRAVNASPGSSILLDDVLIQPITVTGSLSDVTATTPVTTTTTPVTTSTTPVTTTTTIPAATATTTPNTTTVSTATRKLISTTTTPRVTAPGHSTGVTTHKTTTPRVTAPGRSTGVTTYKTTTPRVTAPGRSTGVTTYKTTTPRVTAPGRSTGVTTYKTTSPTAITSVTTLVRTVPTSLDPAGSTSRVKTNRPPVNRSSVRSAAVTSSATSQSPDTTDTAAQRPVSTETTRHAASNSVLMSESSSSAAPQNSDTATPRQKLSMTAQHTGHSRPSVTSKDGRPIPTGTPRPTAAENGHSPHAPVTRDHYHHHHHTNIEGGNGVSQSADNNDSEGRRNLIIGVVVGVCCAVLVLAAVVVVIYRRQFQDSARSILDDAGGKMSDRLVQIKMSDY